MNSEVIPEVTYNSIKHLAGETGSFDVSAYKFYKTATAFIFTARGKLNRSI
jgi:hypothetical protein